VLRAAAAVTSVCIALTAGALTVGARALTADPAVAAQARAAPPPFAAGARSDRRRRLL